MVTINADVEQFHVEAGFDDEIKARAAGRRMAIHLRKNLKDQGWKEFAAVPCPVTWDGMSSKYAGCRILMKWIMPGLPTQWAGQFAVRVDTLASKRALLFDARH